MTPLPIYLKFPVEVFFKEGVDSITLMSKDCEERLEMAENLGIPASKYCPECVESKGNGKEPAFEEGFILVDIYDISEVIYSSTSESITVHRHSSDKALEIRTSVEAFEAMLRKVTQIID